MRQAQAGAAADVSAAGAERDHFKALAARLGDEVAGLKAEAARGEAERLQLVQLCEELAARCQG